MKLRTKAGLDTTRFEGHETEVVASVFLDDGERLASADSNGVVRIWNAGTGEAVASLALGEMKVAALRQAGEAIEVLSIEGELLTLASADLAELDRRPGPSGHGRLFNATPSPDWSRFVAGREGGPPLAFDVASGAVVAEMAPDGYADVFVGFAFSPDASRLAISDYEGRFGVWDVATGRRIHDFGKFRQELDEVAWSPDGARLGASGACYFRSFVWDVSRIPDGDLFAVACERLAAFDADALGPDAGEPICTGEEPVPWAR